MFAIQFWIFVTIIVYILAYIEYIGISTCIMIKNGLMNLNFLTVTKVMLYYIRKAYVTHCLMDIYIYIWDYLIKTYINDLQHEMKVNQTQKLYKKNKMKMLYNNTLSRVIADVQFLYILTNIIHPILNNLQKNYMNYLLLMK